MDALSSGETTVGSERDPGTKTPRTERGRKTLRKLLDASAIEFGEKGFHDASVSSITRRAGVALGSFYTYFDSKDALFQALVRDLSGQVKISAGAAVQTIQKDPEHTAFDIEEVALASFLKFAREHKEIYRIIDESEFVDPDAYRGHYEETASRILGRLQDGAAKGVMRADIEEAHAWAVMGMNVFLGLRYAVWANGSDDQDVAAIARSIIEQGLASRKSDD
ncbi:MAG: TetR/AcrR family transcriptional regulator [Pseudomonadota bacterium]